MRGKLTVLLGLPRAGKSTYAEVWIDYDDYGSNPRVVVNSDQIRLALHNQRYCREAEPFVHAITKVVVRAWYNMGYHLLIDETNTTEGSIRQWLEIDADAEFVYIDTPPDVCKERAYACGHYDLADKGVIDHMYNNLTKLCNRGKVFFDHPNEDDLMMTIEDIRKDVKEKMCRHQ